MYNLWSAMTRLSGKTRSRIGTVHSISGDISVVESPDGQTFNAYGSSASVGATVLIQDNKIVEEIFSYPSTATEVWI